MQNYNSISALYGYETWSRNVKEVLTLSMFENRVLSRIFGPRRKEVTGGWRKLHNEGLHKSYSSSYIEGKKGKVVPVLN
jgi:hypothetical protein